MGDDPFEGISTAERESMIQRARLGRKNTLIARMAFIERAHDVEIAAAFEDADHCSRTTVCRRRHEITAKLLSMGK